MSKYHDHRSDCPFKFAPLDVCDCVEHNMLDHIEQLVAANKSLIKDLKTCRMAQTVMDNTVAELERERDRWREIANNEAVEGEANRNAGLALEAKLAQATWLLTEAAVQLVEGKIKTRRNRAAIIWNLLDEMKADDAP